MAGLLDPSQGDGTYVENRPSKWAQTWGILGPYVTEPVTGAINWTRNMMNASPYTLMTDTGPQARALAEGGAEVATNFMGASSVVPKPDDALNMGFRVFHGSPHDFPPVRLIEMPDGRRLYQNMSELAETPQGARIIQEYPMGRFDLSKIGTGEGAQAYGHGLYFAENEDIARSYRDALSPKKVAIGGQMVDSPTFFKAARRSPSVDDNIAMLTKQRENILKEQAQYTSDPELGDFVSELYDQQLKDVEKELAELLQYRGQWFGTRPGGSMYEVEIDADPDAFLDWDKPLSEQPPAIADALRKIGFEDAKWPYTGLMGPHSMLTKHSPGQEIYNAVGKERGSNSVGSPRDINKVGASEALREAGIPGIKYLDAGSRSAGDGTRNYVVFDDNLINIIRKYGIAGLLGGSAAMDAMMSEPQEQY